MGMKKFWRGVAQKHECSHMLLNDVWAQRWMAGQWSKIIMRGDLVAVLVYLSILYDVCPRAKSPHDSVLRVYPHRQAMLSCT